MPAPEKAAVAREAIAGFLEAVEQAASVDPRPEAKGDPMEWHRHRIHPQLWVALQAEPGVLTKSDRVGKELQAWEARRNEYLGRRPMYSVTGMQPPWDE